MKMAVAAVVVALIGMLIALSALDVWPVLKRSVHLTSSPVEEETEQGPQVPIRVYHYDAARDQSEDGNNLCSRRGVIALGRTVPEREEMVEAAVEETLKGEVTREEREQGITTAFPLPGLELVQVERQDDKVILTFRDPENATNGGACRAALLWYQIEATVLQFENVNDVEFRPLSLFQP